MKNMFYAITCLLFCSILSAIFFIIGKKNSDDKKKPLGPTTIFVYVWNGIYKTIKAHHRRREAHAVKFVDDVPHRLSPEMMATVEKAPVYTMEELEELTTPEPIIITD